MKLGDVDWRKNPQKLARLKFLWEETSMPAREIGEELGVTKNSVIGRAHRSGLIPRAKVRDLPSPPPMARVTFPPKGHCLWADHHVGDPEFFFCGEPVANVDESWCERHRAIVFLPVRPPVNTRGI